jgi:trans-AT polyketide synthase/acyltransferase/oxidoreductase domain-containing protein
MATHSHRTETVSATPGKAAVGYWAGDRQAAYFGPLTAATILDTMRQSVSIIYDPQRRQVGVASGGQVGVHTVDRGDVAYQLLAMLAPLYPEWLGDRSFLERHRLRFAYVGGSMARGIASTDLVIALAEVGALGMFGAAGLSVTEVESAIDRIGGVLDGRGLSWGCNLIHSPGGPSLEDDIVDLYLRRGVRRVEASAFMKLTKPVVRYACTGLFRGTDGGVMRKNHLFAKISREEIARLFLSPAPEAIVAQLVTEGKITGEEASLAREVPLAEQLIVESDSGGHTDNRPLGALFPAIARLRDDLGAQFGYRDPVNLGAAGGLGTPEALAAAYAMGAAFVVLGSVHQSAVESGVNAESRAMLAKAGPADVAMTASADMFEMGVKVQVLSRGTMMAVRGNQLYELYRRHAALDEIAADTRAALEKNVFRMPLDEVWATTSRFFDTSDAAQIRRAELDPKHRMALVFRWYLGNSSRWPINGEPGREIDYQLWCGPAMGTFNRWVEGTFLEPPDARSVQQIALNLLEGAAVVTRTQQFRTYGATVPAGTFQYRPTRLQV